MTYPPLKYYMEINISYSSSYALGFVNQSVSIDEFAELQGGRLFHHYDARAISTYIKTFYAGKSSWYHWLCMLNFYNQFTSDLVSRKCLRPYLTFQYVFFDIRPFKPIKQFIDDLREKPNIVSVCGNKAVRLFYVLDEPYPLTHYSYIYGHFLPSVAVHGFVTDVSTPKVIRADKGAVINRQPYQWSPIEPLY